MLAFHKYIHILFLLTIALFILPATGSAVSAPSVKILNSISSGPITPVNLAEDLTGNFYLTDPKAGSVLKFDRYGVLEKNFAVKAPQGIAVTDTGDIIVGQGDTVAVMDPAGNTRFRLGQGAGQFKLANGIAIDAAGYIYVVDSLDSCVQVFNSIGAPVNTGKAAVGKPANSFGTAGSGNGQFSMPTGIAFEKFSGQLAVADTLNGRIQFLDTTGTWKRSIGGLGAGALRFTFPVSVTFDYANGVLQRMYVTDSFQSSVQVIDPAVNPVFLGFIGSYGKSNGKLMNPSDALIDPVGGRLLVANGFGNITVYSINGGGTPIVDTTPPLYTVNPVTQVTSSRTVTVTGTVEAGANPVLTVNTAAVVGPPTLSSPTEWAITITGLVAGANDITVTAIDSAGNVAAAQTFTVTYSPLAVNLTINSVTTPTNKSSQTISGTMDAGAAVSVSVDTGATAVTTTTGSTWSSIISGLVPGMNTITVIATKAGNDTAISKTDIVVNTTPPALSVSMPAEGSVTSAPLLTVTGLTEVTIASVTINTIITPAINGLFSKGIVLASGANSISITATDTAGNTTTLVRNVTYDPTAPLISITAPVAGKVTNQTTLQVTGTAPVGSSTAIKVNGAVQANVSGSAWTATVNLSGGVGLYAIEATVTAAGKTATDAVTVSLVDLSVPPIELTSPAGDVATNSSSFTFSGAATAASVSATLNGTPLPVTFNPTTGSYTLPVSFTAEGEYILVVTAADAFGSTSSVIRTLLYDITPPSLTVTAQSPTQLTGNGEGGGTVTVRDLNGALVGTAPVSSSGSWNLPLTGTEAKPLNIYSLDAAGNSSRNGDINVSGKVDIADAITAIRIALKLDATSPANSQQLLRGDIGPLDNNGLPRPDGKIDIDDVVVILKKIVGLL